MEPMAALSEYDWLLRSAAGGVAAMFGRRKVRGARAISLPGQGFGRVGAAAIDPLPARQYRRREAAGPGLLRLEGLSARRDFSRRELWRQRRRRRDRRHLRRWRRAHG